LTSPRIAVGSIFQESNEFVLTRTELDLFRNTYVHERDALFALTGTDCEVAGMLAVCTQEAATVVPLVAGRGVSPADRCPTSVIPISKKPCSRRYERPDG